MKKNCIKCKKLFYVYGKRIKTASYCSNNCRRNGEFRECLTCGSTFYAKRKDIKKGWGRFCSHKCWYVSPKTDEHRENIAKWQRGNKSIKWRGGTSKTLTQEYGRYKWQLLRKSVFNRDNYTCRKCGKICVKGELDCHHIIPYRLGKNIKYIFWNISVNDLSNLVSLCKSCHKKTDNEFQKLEKEGKYGFNPIFNLVS